MRYKQKIKVEKNIGDIMALPCVYSCTKELTGGVSYLVNVSDMPFFADAHEGDFIAEDEDGGWHVVKDGRDFSDLAGFHPFAVDDDVENFMGYLEDIIGYGEA